MDTEQTHQIDRFVVKVKKELNPDKIILFGSRANGTHWKRSDYDFIIVSKKFKGMHWLDRISQAVQLWDDMSDVDILPYTPEEFIDKTKHSSVVRSASKSWKVLVG